jgi:transcriptional regulator GlxA family with amidase domain
MATSTPQPLKVLYHLHPSHDTLDFTAPLEVLSQATFTSADGAPTSKVFHHTITAGEEYTTTGQNLTLKRDIPLPKAYATLADYDILLIPGGGTPGVLSSKSEPLDLIQAFCSLPKRADGKIRILLSVCTGSLFLAEAGVLDGLVATTHANYYKTLAELCGGKGEKGTKVVEERFVVNKTDEGKGLRVITSGGVSCGLDSCLWLIEDVAGRASRERAAFTIQYAWREGMIV